MDWTGTSWFSSARVCKHGFIYPPPSLRAGGQIHNTDSAEDVKNVDLSQVHYLSGPIRVPGAKPGDLLKVEFLNLGTLDGDEWGFTGTFAKENGGGFLTDHFPAASKAIWVCCSLLFNR